VESSKFCSFCIWHVPPHGCQFHQKFCSEDKIWLLRSSEFTAMWCQFAVKFRMQYRLDYLMVVARYISGSMHCMFHGWLSDALCGSKDKILIQYYWHAHGEGSTVLLVFNYHLVSLFERHDFKEVENVGFDCHCEVWFSASFMWNHLLEDSPEYSSSLLVCYCCVFICSGTSRSSQISVLLWSEAPSG